MLKHVIVFTDTKRDANDILLNGQADMVALGRAFLTNPRWVWDAANLLGEEIEIPNQYKRRFKKL